MKLLKKYHPQDTIINIHYLNTKLCDSKEVIEDQTESMENVHLGVVLNEVEESEPTHPHAEE